MPESIDITERKIIESRIELLEDYSTYSIICYGLAAKINVPIDGQFPPNKDFGKKIRQKIIEPTDPKLIRKIIEDDKDFQSFYEELGGFFIEALREFLLEDVMKAENRLPVSSSARGSLLPHSWTLPGHPREALPEPLRSQTEVNQRVRTGSPRFVMIKELPYVCRSR